HFLIFRLSWPLFGSPPIANSARVVVCASSSTFSTKGFGGSEGCGPSARRGEKHAPWWLAHRDFDRAPIPQEDPPHGLLFLEEKNQDAQWRGDRQAPQVRAQEARRPNEGRRQRGLQGIQERGGARILSTARSPRTR